MKSEIKSASTPTKLEYPWIGESDGVVVMFQSEKCGMVIHVDQRENNYLGEISSSWDMECFTEFKGSITLSN